MLKIPVQGAGGSYILQLIEEAPTENLALPQSMVTAVILNYFQLAKFTNTRESEVLTRNIGTAKLNFFKWDSIPSVNRPNKPLFTREEV